MNTIWGLSERQHLLWKYLFRHLFFFFFCNHVGVVIMSGQIKPEYQVDMPVKVEESLGTGRYKRHYMVYWIWVQVLGREGLVFLWRPSLYLSLPVPRLLPSTWTHFALLLSVIGDEWMPSRSYSINHNPLLGFSQLQSLCSRRGCKINHNHLDMSKILWLWISANS